MILIEEHGLDPSVKAYNIKRRVLDKLGFAEDPFAAVTPVSSQGSWSGATEKQLALAYATHGNDWDAVAKEVGGEATPSTCNSRWGHLLGRNDVEFKTKDVLGAQVRGFEISFDWEASNLSDPLSRYISKQDEFKNMPKLQILSELSHRWFGKDHVISNALKDGPFLTPNQYLLDRLKLGKQLAREGVMKVSTEGGGKPVGQEREVYYKDELIATLGSGVQHELEEWCAGTEA